MERTTEDHDPSDGTEPAGADGANGVEAVPQRRARRLLLGAALIGAVAVTVAVVAVTVAGGDGRGDTPKAGPSRDIGPGGKTAVAGRVTLDDRPQSGVLVRVDRDGTVLAETLTDANGGYRLAVGEAGMYRVLAAAGRAAGVPCFAIDVIEVGKDATATVDFELSSRDRIPKGPGMVSLGISGVIFRCAQ